MAKIASAPSVLGTLTPHLDGPWIKDPLRPERNTAIGCLAGVAFTRTREQVVHDGLGRTYPIVQTGVRRRRRGQVTVTPLTAVEAASVEVLLDSAATLLLQDEAEADGWPGLHLYFAVTGDDTSTPIGNVPAPQRDVSFGVTESRRPR